MSEINELSKLVGELFEKVTEISKRLTDLEHKIYTEENNLDIIEESLLKASRIFGETNTIQDCLDEINKIRNIK